MLAVYKYKMPYPGRQLTLPMPDGAQLLDCQLQDEDIVAWALVDIAKPVVSRTFVTVGTGHELPAGATSWRHVGTVQDRSLVWHVFEVPTV